MAFPAGNALSIQGMVLVVGAVLGPIAVATFSTMRTLTRVGFQIMEAIKNSVWPELSAAYGAKNLPLARKLHRTACKASLWLSLASVLALLFFGSHIITVWTHGRVVADVGTFRCLLIVIVLNSLWYTSAVVTIASNTHQRVALWYFAGTASSLLLARILTPHLGITGAALALIAVDVIVGWYVLANSFASLNEASIEFFKSMFRLSFSK
jgi:O-antigen/teichoic acid export membrane protein